VEWIRLAQVVVASSFGHSNKLMSCTTEVENRMRALGTGRWKSCGCLNEIKKRLGRQVA
jgi:hypothetical protein